MARVWPEASFLGPRLAVKSELKSSNLPLLQRFSRVERATGIEPALSAWEW